MKNENQTGLERFHQPQKDDFPHVISEIDDGFKCSCWMWYMFPQIAGLGHSFMCKTYELKSIDEARGYLKDKFLHDNLMLLTQHVVESVKNHQTTTESIFGYIDNIKLRSCWTLFEIAADNEADKAIFSSALDFCFDGKRCEKTIELVAKEGESA